MPNIFISNNQKDKPFVKKLALGLLSSAVLVGLAASFLMKPDTSQPIQPQPAVVPIPIQPEARQDFEPEMIMIPAGIFTMGCVSGWDNAGGLSCDEDEKPSREVKVTAFGLAKTEITNKQYFSCVNDGACPAPEWLEAGGEYHIETGSNDHYKKLGEALKAATHPVVGVSWHNAQAYVQWLKQKTGKAYRLPSEAEWEYAARAGSKTTFSWGKKLGNNRANCKSCGSQWDNKSTAPVASFSANAYGLYDMHGNVWEWVQDKWHGDYKDAPSTTKAWEAGNSKERVLRGGSWSDYPRYLRSADRFNFAPDNRFRDIGFRPVLDL